VSELREDAAQQLTGYRSNEEWDELLDETRERLDRIEAWADAQRKDDVLGLLDCLDKVHRESLHRLVRLFKEGVLEQVATDPAIHTLLELYDLSAPSKAGFGVSNPPLSQRRDAAGCPPITLNHQSCRIGCQSALDPRTC